MGEALSKAGYALVGCDMRGHGHSGGARGHTPSYEALLEDIAVLLNRIRAGFANVPVFLYGHSLGGNLVINFALRRKPRIEGVIASAPWLGLATRPPFAKVVTARVANVIAPGLAQDWGLETAALSRAAVVVKDYDDDPLVHGLISARLFVGAYDAGRWALAHAAEFPLPLLLMHGTADRVTSAKASREFALRLGPKVTLRVWEGWYHELHNEPGRAQVLQVILKWMDRKLKRPARRRPVLDKTPRA
jgi:alpha-beta hydrolase superfamily lysophospholipase